MVNYLGFLAVASTLLSTALAQYAAPGACSGICVNTHDPSVVRRESDGTYFRFSTGGKIAVHSAPDISGPWKYEGAAIPDGSIINLKGRDDLWAPDVTLIGDTYYLYYTVSSFGSQNSAIGYATSPTMDVGSWTDHGSTGIQSGAGKPYNAIDPALIWANEQFHMTFGSFWDGIYQASMANPPTKVTGSAHQVALEPVTTAVEGPYVFTWGDNFYLFFSEGKCCGFDTDMPAKGKEYKIMVCRSRDPTSGFVDANGRDCRNGGGTVVLESHDNIYGPGGQGVTMDSQYGPILYYHYVDTNIGYADGDKRFGWNKLDFSSGWPVAL